MRRFTIRTLMALVILTAVGLAALRNADGLWAGCLLLVTLGLLLTSVLGAIYTAGRCRAGWLGFSLFGFAYLALAFSPLLPVRVTGNLPTLQLLNYVHTRVSDPQTGMSGAMMMSMMGGGGMMGGAGMMSGSGVAVTSGSPTPTLWKTYFPGAANYESFTSIGHCLFALLAGLLGAVIARGLEKRRLGATP